MFEWMIRSMRKWLKKLLRWYLTDYEHLYTLLAEIQTAINNTSLKFLYDNPTEMKILQRNCSLQITWYLVGKSICWGKRCHVYGFAIYGWVWLTVEQMQVFAFFTEKYLQSYGCCGNNYG